MTTKARNRPNRDPLLSAQDRKQNSNHKQTEFSLENISYGGGIIN